MEWVSDVSGFWVPCLLSFGCLAATSASSRGWTSNVCLDFAGFLVTNRISRPPTWMPTWWMPNHLSVFVVLSINFSCLAVQFGFASATECWCIYSRASENPFVYPRTTVAAAATAMANASRLKTKYGMPWNVVFGPHCSDIQVHNLLTAFDESYFHFPDENIAGLLWLKLSNNNNDVA